MSDEEHLEWILPILQEVVAPSTIVVQLSAHLEQDDINKIRKMERVEGTARANRFMINCLRTLAQKEARSQNPGTQSTPIFTALLDILRTRGYETVDSLCRDPQKIIGWKYHKRLFDYYLPILSEKIIAEDFMVHLCAAGLFRPHTPEYELVMARAKNEGNCIAMLDVLGQVWRRKENWSHLLITALSNYSQEVDDENLNDAIDTMEKKISSDRKEVEDEEAGNSGTAAHANFMHSNNLNDVRRVAPPAEIIVLETDRLSEFSDERNSADPSSGSSTTGHAPLGTNSKHINNLNDCTDVKGVAPPAATNILETDGQSESSEESNSVYPTSEFSPTEQALFGIEWSKFIKKINAYTANYKHSNNLNDYTDVKEMAPPAATNVVEMYGLSDISQEINSAYGTTDSFGTEHASSEAGVSRTVMHGPWDGLQQLDWFEMRVTLYYFGNILFERDLLHPQGYCFHFGCESKIQKNIHLAKAESLIMGTDNMRRCPLPNVPQSFSDLQKRNVQTALDGLEKGFTVYCRNGNIYITRYCKTRLFMATSERRISEQTLPRQMTQEVFNYQRYHNKLYNNLFTNPDPAVYLGLAQKWNFEKRNDRLAVTMKLACKRALQIYHTVYHTTNTFDEIDELLFLTD